MEWTITVKLSQPISLIVSSEQKKMADKKMNNVKLFNTMLK